MPFPLLAVLALAGGASKLAGGVLNALGQNQQTDDEIRRLHVIAALNRQTAGQVRRNANEEAGRVVTQGSQQASQIGVGFAAGGIDPSTGTAAKVQGDTQMWSEADARRVQLNAAMKARGYEATAVNAEGQAKKLRSAQTLANVGTVLGLGGQAAATAYGIGSSFPDLFSGGGLPAAGALSASQGLAAADPMGQARGDGETVYARYGGRRPVSTGRGRRLWSDLWEES